MCMQGVFCCAMETVHARTNHLYVSTVLAMHSAMERAIVYSAMNWKKIRNPLNKKMRDGNERRRAGVGRADEPIRARKLRGWSGLGTADKWGDEPTRAGQPGRQMRRPKWARQPGRQMRRPKWARQMNGENTPE